MDSQTTSVPATKSASPEDVSNILTTAVMAASATSTPSAAVFPLNTPAPAEALSVAPSLKLAPAMPAPKTQAPQRPRRMPAVDPSALIPTRRSSTRSIKRKKFDDELVESSLVKTERSGRNLKAGASVSSTMASIITAATAASASSSCHLPHPTMLGHVVHSQGLHITTPAVPSLGNPASVAPPDVTVLLASTSPAVVKGSDSLARGDVTNAAGAVTIAAASPIPMVTTIAVAATATAASSGILSLPGHSVVAQNQSGKEHGVKGDLDNKHPESPASVKPPPEKRSKPSSGKAGSSSTKGGGGGGGGGKVASSRQVSQKAGGSKTAGARAGVAKSKSRVNARSKSKRSKKQKTATPAVKDLGRWKPHDDLALITAVQQTNDLSAVHTGVKFSCCFTLKEIEERWYALLYDPAISKVAMEAARQLHSETVATIQGKALYSNAEEKLLGTIASTSQPTVDTFQSLLQQHPDVFHPARTAKTLQCHWLLMKQYHLLPDQTVQPMPRGDHILNLSDIEDFMNDDDLGEGDDSLAEQEMALVDRRNKREIRHLEQELPKWQVLVDSVTGISMPDFDSQTLGVLRGRLVRYLMRSREISLGRNTKDNHVDVDLSLEGPAWKVSRRQGIIKLRNSGDFFIANESKRPIIIDGKPVLCGNKQKLNNNSVVEISCLRFTFLINQDVINAIRADTTKPAVSNTTTATT